MTFKKKGHFLVSTNLVLKDEYFWFGIRPLPIQIQGDPKLAPPLPGQDYKCSMKTEDSIFKYSLFEYYLEKFVIFNRLFMSERGIL